ncbi:hypothetical protein LCGC14_1292600, partial [marine sediment metagenome]
MIYSNNNIKCRIDLVDNNLTKIPSSIKNLDKLTVLNLEGNPLPEKLANNFETNNRTKLAIWTNK